MTSQLHRETQRRRTFAIISHPDAGKTTLTEKLLLYGGAVRLAGSVTARRNQRRAVSDWMALEQQRGISVTTTVLQFPYRDSVINLLDTPGHEDFSEDTYRTVSAADCVVMLLDRANGIEMQTRKLYHVAKMRGLPVLTFINKMDRPGRDPLELLDEIEREFQIVAFPINWPIGESDRFRGVYDRIEREVHLFDSSFGGVLPAPRRVGGIDDPWLADSVGKNAIQSLKDETDLLEGAGAEFDPDNFLSGKTTPVFFGSALTNFGVEPFLNHLLRIAPPPTPRRTVDGTLIAPVEDVFSGFVFKVQANMDRNHRDRVAFLRVVSGRFERDMSVTNARSGAKVRLSRAQKLFAAEREIAEEAFPGDVIGLSNPGVFAIGDTVTDGVPFQFEGIPQFSPENFATMRPLVPTKRKQMLKGLDQLREEGAVQVFWAKDMSSTDPILGAIGPLQFDVVRFRLESEYNVECRLDVLPFSVARWISGERSDLTSLELFGSAREIQDSAGRPVILFENEWSAGRAVDRHPKIDFTEVAQIL